MKQVKEKKKKRPKKAIGFVSQMHPKRLKKIQNHRVKTIKQANLRLFAEIRNEKYKKQSQKRQNSKNLQDKQVDKIAEEIKKVRFDEDSNQIHEFQCWIESYQQYFDHQQSLDYIKPPQKQEGKKSVQNKGKITRNKKKLLV